MIEHHAYLYKRETDLPSTLALDGIDTVTVRSAQFGIDEARQLQYLALLKTLAERATRDIVVVADRIRYEAQNALLKILEEPPAHTVFHLVIRDHHSLLPTVRSRLATVGSSGAERSSLEAFHAFRASSYAERLVAIADAQTEKNSLWMRSVLDGCGMALAENPQDNKDLYQVYTLLCAHFDGPGASNKMLFEHLALAL